MRSILIFLLTCFSMAFAVIAREQDPALCYSAIDVVQAQDVTWSFDEFWTNMARQVSRVVGVVRDSHNDSRFGFATFGDKNLSASSTSGRGKSRLISRTPTDYCLRVDAPLTKPDPEAIAKLVASYRGTIGHGGEDWTEGAFEALYRLLLTQKMNWRPRVLSDGTRVFRVVVLVTDFNLYDSGDVKRYLNKTLLPFDSIKDAVRYGPNENIGCHQVDYPRIQDVVHYLKQEQITLFLLVAPKGRFKSGTFVNARALTEARVPSGPEHVYAGEHGLAQRYKDIINYYGFNDVYVSELDNGMLAYSEAFQKALQEFKQARCETLTPQGAPRASPYLSRNFIPVANALESFHKKPESRLTRAVDRAEPRNHAHMQKRATSLLDNPHLSTAGFADSMAAASETSDSAGKPQRFLHPRILSEIPSETVNVQASTKIVPSTKPISATSFEQNSNVPATAPTDASTSTVQSSTTALAQEDAPSTTVVAHTTATVGNTAGAPLTEISIASATDVTAASPTSAPDTTRQSTGSVDETASVADVTVGSTASVADVTAGTTASVADATALISKFAEAVANTPKALVKETNVTDFDEALRNRMSYKTFGTPIDHIKPSTTDTDVSLQRILMGIKSLGLNENTGVAMRSALSTAPPQPVSLAKTENPGKTSDAIKTNAITTTPEQLVENTKPYSECKTPHHRCQSNCSDTGFSATRPAVVSLKITQSCLNSLNFFFTTRKSGARLPCFLTRQLNTTDVDLFQTVAVQAKRLGEAVIFEHPNLF